MTGIGVGTAFGLLVLLMVIISVVGWLSTHVLDKEERLAAVRSGHAEAEAHDKALAAFVAVTALLSTSGQLEGPDGAENG